jgi:heme exporter protein C
MATTAKYVLGLWMIGVIALAYGWLPAAQGFQVPEAARIIALHLPNAVVAVVAAFVSAFWGWRYLARGRDPRDDARSKNAVALAALFCVLTTATGSVFARVQWGSYWNWDPKQTCIVVLLLIYAAYFVLRAAVEDEEKRGTVAAVYVCFAAIMTPVLGYVIPKYLPSLHPTNTVFDGSYKTVLLLATLGFLGLYLWMQGLANRYEFARITLARQEAAAAESSRPAVVLRNAPPPGARIAGDREEVTL